MFPADQALCAHAGLLALQGSWSVGHPGAGACPAACQRPATELRARAQGAWHCANPSCARGGGARRVHWGGLALCARCGRAAARHGRLAGTGAAGWLLRSVPVARSALCMLRDAGLVPARP